VALTDDQKAMLRLLAQREEGYEDMAAVMGISVEEVRERVKEALTEVDQPEAPEPEPAPAPVPPPASPSPPPSEPKPETPLPPAEPTPTPVEPSPETPAQSAPPSKRPTSRSRIHLPKDRGALIGLGAGALVLIVLAIVLAVSGGGSNSSDSASTTSAESTTASDAANSSLTEAVLSPTDGGDSSGRALFGRYKKNVLLQVEAAGLDPSSKGQAYAVWLFRSPKVALQIGAVPVDDSGKIGAQFQIPAQLLGYVASGAFNQVDVSLIDTADYKAAFTKAKSENRLPPYSGESVLRGEITGPAIK
jgi:outer membrane biosynthesis protein TonB